MKLIGDWYIQTLKKCAKIVRYQWKNNISKGIRGFIFYGNPGNGKTTIAKEIVGEAIDEIRDIDLQKHMIFKDCADLALPKYGETEKEIRKVFVQARSNNITPIIYIFDDADGLFVTRDYGPKLDAWYIGQLNVLFHELDKMDTSKECVILTTNRIDLLDKALIDRLYSIKFPDPSKVILEQVATELALNTLKMDRRNVTEIKNIILEDESIKTFRDMERKVYEIYIESITSEN